MGCIQSSTVSSDGGVGYLLSPKQATSLAKLTPEEVMCMEKHARALCADHSGPASEGPSRLLLLIRVMAISVGSAKRHRQLLMVSESALYLRPNPICGAESIRLI
jgi:hypothetical protein